jgi:hypothetical protein
MMFSVFRIPQRNSLACLGRYDLFSFALFERKVLLRMNIGYSQKNHRLKRR